MDPSRMGMKGFQIEKDEDFNELTLKRKLDSKWAVRFKARSQAPESIESEAQSSTEVQLEYEYQKDQDVLFRMDENEKMFGVRKKMDF